MSRNGHGRPRTFRLTAEERYWLDFERRARATIEGQSDGARRWLYEDLRCARLAYDLRLTRKAVKRWGAAARERARRATHLHGGGIFLRPHEAARALGIQRATLKHAPFSRYAQRFGHRTVRYSSGDVAVLATQRALARLLRVGPSQDEVQRLLWRMEDMFYELQEVRDRRRRSARYSNSLYVNGRVLAEINPALNIFKETR